MSSLPVEAQAGISAALGRDQAIYHARPEGEVVRLGNPRHGFEAVFTAEGMALESGRARLQLGLRGVGRGAKLEAVVPASPEATANRIDYRRGGLGEWYVNGPLGLEQGFTLETPPGKPTGEALTLALDLGGDLRATPAAEGLALVRADGSTALRYRGLVAWDSTGRKLPAWWQGQGREVRLRVDDTGARYPVTIDPIFQQAKLTASDGEAFDFFGISVAVSGDTVVVGAYLDVIDGNLSQGSAYVFVKPAEGWFGLLRETAKLTASDGAAFDSFGSSVSVSGDTVVAAGRNTAYVFVEPAAGGWSGALHETAKLTARTGRRTTISVPWP